MKPLDDLISAAKANPRRIALAEGEDPRIIEAAIRAERDGLARIVLVGADEKIRALLAGQGGDPGLFTIADPAGSPLAEPFAHRYHALRKNKGVDLARAREAMGDPLNFAAMMVREGHADGTIGGAVATTAHTIRAARRHRLQHFPDAAVRAASRQEGRVRVRRLRFDRRAGCRDPGPDRDLLGGQFPQLDRGRAACRAAVVLDRGQRQA
jgi:hypothetical protein